MKIKIKYATISHIEKITNIYEDDAEVIIEYNNGYSVMGLDKEDFTLEEVKSALNK